MMYINNTEMEVMPIVLRRMVFLTNQIAQDSNFDWGAFGQPPAKSVKMGGDRCLDHPDALRLSVVQKYFTQGLMVGSVKG